MIRRTLENEYSDEQLIHAAQSLGYLFGAMVCRPHTHRSTEEPSALPRWRS